MHHRQYGNPPIANISAEPTYQHGLSYLVIASLRPLRLVLYLRLA